MARLPISRTPAKEIPLVPVGLPPTSDPSLEAEFFWEENKSKILAALVVIILAIVVSCIWQFNLASGRAEQAAAFDAARTPDQLQAIITKYPDTVVAGNAALIRADQLRSAGKYEDALKLLSDFTTKQPEHPLIADAWMSYAATLEYKNELSKAADTYLLIASKYATSQAAPAALAAQARLAKKAGDSKKARGIYENLVQRFPTSLWSQQAQQEIDRLPKD